MTSWAPTARRQEALRELDERLASEPGSVALQFERACLLAETGQTEPAKSAYLELLAHSPGHAAALNNLGTLLYSTGYRTAARTAYTEAIQRHPEDPMAYVNLANLLLEAGELIPAREHYETALSLDPEYGEAHRGLGNLLEELGDQEASREHQRRGRRDRHVTEIPYRGETQPVTVLLLVSGRRGNVPVRHFLDDRIFRTFALPPDFYDPDAPLPPHQVVFNTIGDADLCGPALDSAVNLTERTLAPVINAPAAVLGTGRIANARRLAGLPGVVAPLTALMSRQLLEDAADLRFPLLLRAPGFHNGRHFVRVDTPNQLPAALAALPGAALIAIQFLDGRGSDGNYRKYRVMLIDGRLYPLHLAISRNWKIHYVTADMADHTEHRAEEARFLADMPAVLGPKAMTALALIQETLALDYAGIDFGLSPAGDLLFFEANATMVVPSAGDDERWAYRRDAVKRIEDAVRKMLVERAGVPSAPAL